MPIPFDHRELGLVQPADLAVAKHAAYCVDVRVAVRQQALHVRLGRGLQVEGAAVGALEPMPVDLRVTRCVMAERRRVYLEDLAPGEERACALEHGSTLSCDGGTR